MGDALSFREKGTIIIQGDFNCRTGNQSDFIAQDKSDDLFHILNYYAIQNITKSVTGVAKF